MTATEQLFCELRVRFAEALSIDGGVIGPATDAELRSMADEFVTTFRRRKYKREQLPLTADAIRGLYDYEPSTGFFTHRASKGKIRAGDRTSEAVNSAGYQRVAFGTKSLAAHRAAWLHVHGEWPSGHVDHINGNRTDNRIANLRVVTPTGNRQNQRVATPGNKSGLLGVSSYVKASGELKFIAQIGSRGKRRYIGTYSTPEEAHAAYVAEKRKVHETCTI